MATEPKPEQPSKVEELAVEILAELKKLNAHFESSGDKEQPRIFI